MKISIRTDLENIAGYAQYKYEHDKTYTKRLILAVNEKLNENPDLWETLSDDAQEFFNEVAEALDENKDTWPILPKEKGAVEKMEKSNLDAKQAGKLVEILLSCDSMETLIATLEKKKYKADVQLLEQLNAIVKDIVNKTEMLYLKA